MDEKIEVVLAEYDARMARERAGSLPPDQRLLAVGPETGRLINIVARALRAPRILEIGTSFGYSAIWLGHAARESGGRLTTLELQANKSAYAREMSAKAGLADHVDFLVGDALDLIAAQKGPFDFVLLDLWKDLYTPCLEAMLPKLNPGAIIVADNIIRPGGENIARYLEAVRAVPGMSSLTLPVGTGIEVSRYDP